MMNQNQISEIMLYLDCGHISISTGLYRLHLKEISKAEQKRIAFYRIRIAGNNYKEGYGTKVRLAITENPFTNYQDSRLFQKTTRLNNLGVADLQNALLNITKAISLNPKVPEYHSYQGNIFLRLQRFKEEWCIRKCDQDRRQQFRPSLLKNYTTI